MRTLWPLVASVVIVFAFAVIAYWVYLIGAEVGKFLEYVILAIPGFLHDLPLNIGAAFSWLSSRLWNAVANPLRTACTILGMLLVVTYFRATLGHFNTDTSIFRGSAVRNAEDVFPDFDQTGGDVERSEFRGSSVSNAEDIFNLPTESLWSRLWQSIKSLFTRTSAGDDLP